MTRAVVNLEKCRVNRWMHNMTGWREFGVRGERIAWCIDCKKRWYRPWPLKKNDPGRLGFGFVGVGP